MSGGISGLKIGRGEDDGDSQIAVSFGADFCRTCLHLLFFYKACWLDGSMPQPAPSASVTKAPNQK